MDRSCMRLHLSHDLLVMGMRGSKYPYLLLSAQRTGAAQLVAYITEEEDNTFIEQKTQ